MQLTAFTLLFTIFTAVTARPALTAEFSLDKPGACVGGSYDVCKASYVCAQSWPESCICYNKLVTRCADNCKVMFIPEHYQDCGNTPNGHKITAKVVRKDADVETVDPVELKNVREPEFKELEKFPTSQPYVARPTPKKLKSGKCYDSCLGEKVCVMMFPASCYCENNNRQTCAKKCGVKATGIQNCKVQTENTV